MIFHKPFQSGSEMLQKINPYHIEQQLSRGISFNGYVCRSGIPLDRIAGNNPLGYKVKILSLNHLRMLQVELEKCLTDKYPNGHHRLNYYAIISETK